MDKTVKWALIVIALVILWTIGSCNDSSSSSSNSTSCGHESCKENGPFYCVGKNDTCKNKTDCAYDLYCDQCEE